MKSIFVRLSLSLVLAVVVACTPTMPTQIDQPPTIRVPVNGVDLPGDTYGEFDTTVTVGGMGSAGGGGGSAPRSYGNYALLSDAPGSRVSDVDVIGGQVAKIALNVNFPRVREHQSLEVSIDVPGSTPAIWGCNHQQWQIDSGTLCDNLARAANEGFTRFFPANGPKVNTITVIANSTGGSTSESFQVRVH